MRIKIVIYEPETGNHEAINKCFQKFEGTDIVLVTELEEAERLCKMADKYIFSLSNKEKEEVVLAEKISKEKPTLVLQNDGKLLKFGKFRPEISFYFMSGTFRINNEETWKIALKELNNIH